MREVEAFIAKHADDKPLSDNHLEHYASKYYDPAKAREYYLRTRELKGRKKLASNQREAWNYTREKISTEKKTAKDTARNQQAAKLEAFRKRAEESREKIAASLEDYLAKLTGASRIPTNASPKLRAFLTKQNAAKRATAKRSTAAQLRKVSGELRDALQTARDSYKNVQKNLDAKYKQISDQEFENIRTKIAPEEPPKKTRTRK